MRFGVWVPNFGDYADPQRLADFARDAEDAGWDGFFLWDHVFRDRKPAVPTVDPWIALAAIATRTRRVRIGTLVTPIPRRRPWKLAREVVSLDHLSNGRVVLGVGSGSPVTEFECFGEDSDPKARAGKLDEGLEILTRLWSGEEVHYQGVHYRVCGAQFLPTPVQKPRIPIWVAGVWPAKPPFRRAARWDGVFPLQRDSPLLTAPDLKKAVDFVRCERTDLASFDVVVTGSTPGDDATQAAETVRLFREAGATWWLEWVGWRRGSFDEMRTRVRQGPCRA